MNRHAQDKIHEVCRRMQKGQALIEYLLVAIAIIAAVLAVRTVVANKTGTMTKNLTNQIKEGGYVDSL